jgi:hypothetical protein
MANNNYRSIDIIMFENCSKHGPAGSGGGVGGR